MMVYTTGGTKFLLILWWNENVLLLWKKILGKKIIENDIAVLQ